MANFEPIPTLSLMKMIRQSLAVMMTQRDPRAFRTLGNDSEHELDTDLELTVMMMAEKSLGSNFNPESSGTLELSST